MQDGTRQLPKDDGHLVFVGGNYDFQVVQIFAEAQYYKGQLAASGFDMTDIDGTNLSGVEGFEGMKGYGLHFGAVAPVGAGTVTAGLYYVDGSVEHQIEGLDVDTTFWGLSARYNYPLSERTGLYVGAGYCQAKFELSAGGESFDLKNQTTQVYGGLVHTF